MRIAAILLTSVVLGIPVHGEYAPGVSSYCNEPSTWPADKVDGYKSRCDKMSKSIEAHNKKKGKRKAWIKEHSKSDLMTQIFASRNDRIPEEVVNAEEIIWTYKSQSGTEGGNQCNELVFGTKGDLKSRRTFECE